MGGELSSHRRSARISPFAWNPIVYRVQGRYPKVSRTEIVGEVSAEFWAKRRIA